MSLAMTAVIGDIDALIEGFSVVFAVIVIIKLKRVDFLFNQKFRNPLHYFIAGMAAVMFAMLWEFVSQHLLMIDAFWSIDIRDVLLAAGITLASIAAYKLSALLHPIMPKKEQTAASVPAR